MRVALVHDDLVQWGGAERVLEGICEIFPDAPIYTSVYDSENIELKKRFGSRQIRTSFLQKIPFWKMFYKVFLPFYPIAFEQFNFDGYDLVISNTTRFAKCIITKPTTKHVSYVHTPPRFLWHFSGQASYGIAEILMSWLRLLDQVTSSRVDYFLAGSKNATERIKKIYRVDSKVVYPFVDLKRFKNIKTIDGDYFVVIGRPNKYKRFDLAREACSKLGLELKTVSGGLKDSEVIEILAGCRALIIPGIEDFGLTSLEAQALGKPIIAYREGGVLETIIENQTGLFFDEPIVESLVESIKRFDSTNFNIEIIKDHAQKFSKENFIRNFKQTVDSL